MLFLSQFLIGINLLTVSSLDRYWLEAPITMKELKAAVASLSKGKAPSWNDLLDEVCIQYGSILMPLLIQVFNVALVASCLSLSTV